MRSVLVLGLLLNWCASADAATLHRSKPRHVIVRPSQNAVAPKGVAVPGWTDEQTRQWLDKASAGAYAA